MPDRLDNAFLNRECSAEVAETDVMRARRIADTLGPLASRWMTADALRIAGLGNAPPRLPATVPPGAFHVLVAVRGDFPALQPAFVLPLRWVRDGDHSRRLPATLLEHADQAVVLNGARPGAGKAGRWGLHPHFSGDLDFDLSGLEIDGASAMAAMLAALQLAEVGNGAVGTVLASAEWNGTAWSRVESIAEKLDAARDCGATRVFLSDDNEAEVDAWERSNGGLPIVGYLRAESNPWKSLEPFLHEVEAPPLPDAPLALHDVYFQRALAPRPKGDAGRDYYLEKLVRPIAAKCENDPGVRDIPGPVRCLVGCVAPGTPPAVALLARLLRPAMVRLLHSPLSGDRSGQLAGDLRVIAEHLRGEAGVPDVQPWELDLFGLSLEGLAERLREKFSLAEIRTIDRAGDGPLVVDVTNGPKRLSLAILKALPVGATCVLVDSEQSGGRVHRIGSEQVVVIRSIGG